MYFNNIIKDEKFNENTKLNRQLFWKNKPYELTIFEIYKSYENRS